MADDAEFRRQFFQQLDPARPLNVLEAEDQRRYVPIYSNPALAGDDPVEQLVEVIALSLRDSCQLLSGTKGSGKSTELSRLTQRLQEEGYVVIRYDVEDVLSIDTPIDITDFLLSLCGAVAEEVDERSLLRGDPARKSLWERFQSILLDSHIEITEFGIGTDWASVKAELRRDPDLKDRIQSYMAGRIQAFIVAVHRFLNDLRLDLLKSHDVVGAALIVDSLDHARGTAQSFEGIQNNLARLFQDYNDALAVPEWQVVYTVPPWIRALVDTGAYNQFLFLPNVKVAERDNARTVFQPGLDVMEQVVAQRGDWKRLLGDRSHLDELGALSGGYLRDLFRLLQGVLIRREVPASHSARQRAVDQLRNEMNFFSDADRAWLQRVTETHEIGLTSPADRGRFAQFLDTHVVLGYRNGLEWYDVHPLVRDLILE